MRTEDYSTSPMLRRGVVCQVCGHPDRASIEIALANHVPARVLAKRHGVHHDALYRHSHHHMRPELHAALMTRGRLSPTDLENLRMIESEGALQHLVAVRGRLYGLMDIAEQQGDYRAAAVIAERITRVIEVQSKLLGDIKVGTFNITNNLLLTGEYHALRTAIMQALASHPEARADVAAALRAFQDPVLPSPETLEERAEAEPVMAKAREVTRQVRARKVIEGEARRVRSGS